MQLIDVLRSHPGKLSPCELVPRFELAQPTVSHHPKVLRDASILNSEKHGLFVYYYVRAGALDTLANFLTPA
ncbi:MAG: metalloregulator ArsR/SmtB family transcription factor [Solirubrobacteraceae bacterium]